jgi:hypothetical protein
MKPRKFNKYERKEIRERKLRNDMVGTGLYIYENNTGGDLTLPKPTATGLRRIGPKERFQGDSYYQKWGRATDEYAEIYRSSGRRPAAGS